jgi:predicted permease
MVVALLALGVGANAATLAVADQLFFRQPEGVVNPRSLHRLYLRTNQTVGRVTAIKPQVSYLAFKTIADAVGDRASMTAYTHPDSIDSRIGAVRGFVRVSYALPSYLPLVGARLARGRTFTEAEGTFGAAERVAVISHALWESRFAGDAGAIGQRIEIAGERYTIIGVAEAGFSGIDLDRADLWLPLATMPYSAAGDWYRYWRQNTNVRILMRAAPGTSDETLATVATTAYRRGSAQYDRGSRDTTGVVLAGPLLESLGPSVTRAAEQAITPRLIAVAVMLLIVACANVANLLLLRALRRRREIALRVALGIPRERLFRQVMFEGLMLSLVAALVAVGVGGWGASLLRSTIMPSVHWAASAWSPRLALLAIPIALVAGLAAGIAPAISAFDGDVTNALKSGGRDGVTRASRARVGLIVLQGALSVVLLVGAGLFIRSFDAVRSIDVGYSLDDVSYAWIQFRDPVTHVVDIFGENHAEEMTDGLRRAAARLERSPNVRSVALSQALPMAAYGMTRVFTSDRQSIPDFNNRNPVVLEVSPSYFDVTGVQLVRGRFFTDADATRSGEVIVINETAARSIFPGRDAIGQCLMISRPLICATIIGITRDVHVGDFLEPRTLQFFQPLDALNRHYHPGTLIVRGRAGRGAAAMADLRREVQRALPGAEPPYIQSAWGAREPELRPWRVGAVLFGVFGALALLVATIGVYSVIAFSVNQRMHEMGVRIALGAKGQHIARMVGVQAVWPIVLGVLIGVTLSQVMGRAVEGMLFGVTVWDPFTLGSVAGVLVMTGAIGAMGPAWRATTVPPVEALRAE